MDMDLSKYHLGNDGFYYNDYVAPEKPETFTGKFVSSKWWHKGSRFALICNFETEDDRRIALFAFQRYTGFYGPRFGETNFKNMETHTFWQCEIQATRTGRCYWASARQIKQPDENDRT